MHTESMDGVQPCTRNDYAEPQAKQEALMLGKLRANDLFGTQAEDISDADEKERPDQRGEGIEDQEFRQADVRKPRYNAADQAKAIN